MNWNLVENDVENGEFHKRVSEDGKFCVLVYPVIFGFRVRAGFAGEMWYELDYCAGADYRAVESIYTLVISILDRDKTFRNFPNQNSKPMHNDPECMLSLIDLAGGTDLEKFKYDFSDLHELKTNYIKKLL